ncbi:hypothetical protein [Haloprofundus halobius]|uniref:hypothetical protein n=1 Tax=Haloprofundus halobius TaxID=2876194 RepID=UPI001CC971AF|nr:hypothetical protein [Haloprofundus halobius]
MSPELAGSARHYVEELKRAERPDDVALNVETRTVSSNNGCPYVNPTDFGLRMLGLGIGDDVHVATFHGAIVILPEGVSDA